MAHFLYHRNEQVNSGVYSDEQLFKIECNQIKIIGWTYKSFYSNLSSLNFISSKNIYSNKYLDGGEYEK